MNKLPQLRGKHYHTVTPKGERKLWTITGIEIGEAVSGATWIERIKVQSQYTTQNGYIGWTAARWISYGKHIAQRIAAYEREFGVTA